MIRNYEALALTLQNLRMMEEGLIELHKRLFVVNQNNYFIYAEGYMDMILELRSQIDAFLGISPRVAEKTTSVPLPESVAVEMQAQ